MRLLILLPAILLSFAAAGQVRASGEKQRKPDPKTAPTVAAPPASAAPVPAPAAHETFAVTVSGSITTTEGLPLPGATVWISTTRQILAVTNAQGEFTLNLPTNSAVTLTCGYAGYGDQQIRLRQPHRNNDLSISLAPLTTAKAR